MPSVLKCPYKAFSYFILKQNCLKRTFRREVRAKLHLYMVNFPGNRNSLELYRNCTEIKLEKLNLHNIGVAQFPSRTVHRKKTKNKSKTKPKTKKNKKQKNTKNPNKKVSEQTEHYATHCARC